MAEQHDPLSNLAGFAHGSHRRRIVSRPHHSTGTQLPEIGTRKLIEIDGRIVLPGFGHNPFDRRIREGAVRDDETNAEGAKKLRIETVKKNARWQWIDLVLRLGQHVSIEIIHVPADRLAVLLQCWNVVVP